MIFAVKVDYVGWLSMFGIRRLGEACEVSTIFTMIFEGGAENASC